MKKILLFEPDKSLGDTLKLVIQELHFSNVDIASTEEEAYSFLCSGEYDSLILEYWVATSDSCHNLVSTAARVWARMPDVVLLYDPPIHLIPNPAFPVSSFLAKPCDFDKLESVLNS